MARSPLARTVRPAGPVDLVRTLAPARRGRGDPTMRLAPGWCVRATRTPDGPAAIELRAAAGRIDARAWGPGAEGVLDGVPALLGLDDPGDRFDPRHPGLRDVARRHPGVRFGRTGAVAEAVVASVLEQRVTTVEALRSWRHLVTTLGEPAPGPLGLHVPPAPEVLAATPTWVFHRAGVEARRSETIRRAMRVASRLEACTALPIAEARRRLAAVPGIGPWTVAEVAAVALGDVDAVSVGDYHLKHIVCWSLAGERPGTDERMLELLAPWAGDRARIVRLIGMTPGSRPPRRAPRARLRRIAAI